MNRETPELRGEDPLKSELAPADTGSSQPLLLATPS